MTLKKHYYSIVEVSTLLDLTIDELMHYGITGQLYMCFDWALIKTEISVNNLPLELTFEFEGHERYLWQQSVRDTLNSDHTDYPLGRLFPISTGFLSVILKYGFIKLKSAYDNCIECTLKISKIDVNDEQVKYPSLKLRDIVISSGSYERFVKSIDLNKGFDDDSSAIKEDFEADNVPNNLYFAYSLNKEVWPIPKNMNLPSKKQLEELVYRKDPDLCQADIDAIIRLSTPDGNKLGGKQKKDKISFMAVKGRGN